MNTWSINTWHGLRKIGDNRKDSMKFETSINSDSGKRYYEIAYKRTYDDKKSQVCDYFFLMTGLKRLNCLSMKSTGQHMIC